MDTSLAAESKRLEHSWMRWDRVMLRDYLVRDVEDPRINVQSILTRHFLIEGRFGARYEVVAEHELRFAVIVNWVMRLLKEGADSARLREIRDVLQAGAGDDCVVPEFLRETYSQLTFPNYVHDLLSPDRGDVEQGVVPDRLKATFERVWRELLGGERESGLRVVEPACGSANDYRYLDAYGIARLIEYTGFDLCSKNVCNARRMFGDVRFEVGNVLEIAADDKTYDCCFVHDLFEHLSPAALERAIAEICRVTRGCIFAHFFNMTDAAEHLVRPVGSYHWNVLSAWRVQELFEQHGGEVQVIGIDGFLSSRFGYALTHNKEAYTLVVSM